MWRKGDTSEDCPQCGYPTGQYGIYEKGSPCGKCGYIDKEAAKEQAKIETERRERVHGNRINPPQFKSIEDWENEAYK